jgi:gamma-glutamyltranspeptidase/glutathione hydrolase
MKWSDLISPAINQAKAGYILSIKAAENLNKYQSELIKLNNNDFFLINKNSWKVGDTVISAQLAITLEQISSRGKDGFYKGVCAEDIVESVSRQGGIMDLEDLANYTTKWRPILAFPFKDYTILSMNLPSSGGILLAQLLQGFKQFNADTMKLNSATYIHLNAELERRVFADRAEFLGDPDFANIPVAWLLDSIYLHQRFSTINLKQATPSKEVKHGKINYKESSETTHINILDRWGNAVSITTTLNGNLGSKLAAQKSGFMLNNEMDDFSIQPGIPNQFGLLGSEANRIEGGKRMLSSMTPTIVLLDNEPVLIVGSPGGSRIITSVYQCILNSLVYDLDAQDAVNLPRFHSQWYPDTLYYEKPRTDSLLLDSLRQMDHHVYYRDRNGRVKLIRIKNNIVQAAGDTMRAEDCAIVR